jgi:hypothetical protein
MPPAASSAHRANYPRARLPPAAVDEDDDGRAVDARAPIGVDSEAVGHLAAAFDPSLVGPSAAGVARVGHDSPGVPADREASPADGVGGLAPPRLT